MTFETGPSSNADVLNDRNLTMLMTETLGQLRVQHRLTDVLRELAEQATNPCQAHTLILLPARANILRTFSDR